MPFIVKAGHLHLAKIGGNICLTISTVAKPKVYKVRSAANRQAFYFRKHHGVDARVEEIVVE
jgi:hypothetical protein